MQWPMENNIDPTQEVEQTTEQQERPEPAKLTPPKEVYDNIREVKEQYRKTIEQANR